MFNQKYKFGLLGKKLSHSFSPDLHQKFFIEKNIDASYDLFEIAEEELPNFMSFVKENNIFGFNVTIPYKTIIIPYLDYIEENAKKIGAINTVLYKNNKFYGYNTDYFGFIETLKLNNIDVFEKDVAIIGRGGAAKAVYVALKNLGARVTFFYRKDKNSEINFDDLKKSYLIINATPVGMYPNTDASPTDEEILKKFDVAIDLIYNPEETIFLKLAKKNNLITMNGMTMLEIQAKKAQEIWLENLKE